MYLSTVLFKIVKIQMISIRVSHNLLELICNMQGLYYEKLTSPVVGFPTVALTVKLLVQNQESSKVYRYFNENELYANTQQYCASEGLNRASQQVEW